MLKQIVLAAALTAFFAAGSLAQEKGPNGGQVVDVEGHPIELVVSGSALTFYFMGHDGGVEPTEGASGRAIVQADGETTIVNLVPEDPNKLVGKLDAPLAPGAKIALTSKIGGHGMQARFVTE